MKRMLILGVGLSIALLTAGCATTVSENGLSPTQSAIATMAIHAGTAELINHDIDKVRETAGNVVDIATEALLLVDNGTVTVIDDLDKRIHERISELNLSPDKQIVADLLIVMVRVEIENRIGSKVLDPDTVVAISKVLKIMVDTAEIYR